MRLLPTFLLGLCLLDFSMSAAHADASAPELAGVDELLAQPRPAADFVYAYGEDPLQFGELRLPDGPGPFPVVALVHGGCWLAKYDVGHLAAMAEALTASGLATWAIEFRRVGNEGGGWPGTFLDVAHGLDDLRRIAGRHDLDLGRVVVVGHSAGGHLGLWLAGRHNLPPDSPLYLADPLPVKGVIALAPAADLELTFRNQTCSGVSQQLMGGTPEEFPQRYHDGSAAALLPLGMPQVIINGAHDEGWLTVSRAYLDKARAAGDDIRLVVPRDAGHFELVMPASTTFPTVRRAIVRMTGPAGR